MLRINWRDAVEAKMLQEIEERRLERDRLQKKADDAKYNDYSLTRPSRSWDQKFPKASGQLRLHPGTDNWGMDPQLLK